MISRLKRIALLALPGLFVGVALAVSPAPVTSTQSGGETFEVTSTADDVDVDPGDGLCAAASGACTLRAAIQETNALPGHQTVTLPDGEYTLTRPGPVENESATGDLDITDDLTLTGQASEAALTQEVAFGGVERIIDIRPGATVLISDVTVRDVFMSGFLPEDEGCGGGIRNFGVLTLSRVTVRDNVRRGSGAGLCNESGAQVWIQDSVLEQNNAAVVGVGGGLLNKGVAFLDRVIVKDNRAATLGGAGIANWGTLTIQGSLIAGNVTDLVVNRGGGGITNSGSLVVTNSTITANHTRFVGGGVSNASSGAVTVINSTISNNGTDGVSGGGIASESGGTVTLVNSIVADNESGDCGLALDSVLPISLGHNLDGDGSCGLSGPGDLSGVDPLLGELADNGGPTLTHALLAGSPAIDAGDDAECPAADQRGAPRPAGGGCDVGAYEAGAAVPPPAALPGDVDCDWALSPFDLLALLRFVGLLGVPECIALGDLDCDGDADSADALLLLRWLAGIIEPPCVPV